MLQFIVFLYSRGYKNSHFLAKSIVIVDFQDSERLARSKFLLQQIIRAAPMFAYKYILTRDISAATRSIIVPKPHRAQSI